MNSNSIPLFNSKITPSDTEALLLCLSIVNDSDFADSQEQQDINEMLCFSASQKLKKHSKAFSPNELRMMYASLLNVAVFLDGSSCLNVDFETQQKLRKYAPSIYRLCDLFGVFSDIDELC